MEKWSGKTEIWGKALIFLFISIIFSFSLRKAGKMKMKKMKNKTLGASFRISKPDAQPNIKGHQ